MKIFNIIFCILFVICAGLQYNDPDPYVWVPIYLFGAVICWFAFKGEYFGTPMLIGIGSLPGVCGIYLFYHKRWRGRLDQSSITLKTLPLP